MFPWYTRRRERTNIWSAMLAIALSLCLSCLHSDDSTDEYTTTTDDTIDSTTLVLLYLSAQTRLQATDCANAVGSGCSSSAPYSCSQSGFCYTSLSACVSSHTCDK